MAEGATDGGLKGGRFDRILSLTAVIAGAIGFLGIVFACLDWSHSSLTVLRSPSFNLLLFVFSLAAFFVTYLTGLWLITHDMGRLRYTITRFGGLLALSVTSGFVVRYVAAGHL